MLDLPLGLKAGVLLSDAHEELERLVFRAPESRFPT